MDIKIEKAMLKYMRLYLSEDEEISYERLGNGQVFSRVLLYAQGLKFVLGELRENPNNWIQKLANLKLVLKKVNQYFEYKLGKGIKTNDINLIQIAKNNKKSEILKLFEIVLACLTQAPNKEQHINRITTLDEQSQKNFVWLIHKILQNRIIDLQAYRKEKDLKNAQELEYQNTLLQKQIDSILEKITFVQKQYEKLKSHTQSQEAEMLSALQAEGIQKQDKCYGYIVQNEELRRIIESQKQELEGLKHRHQIEVSKLSEEVSILNSRIHILQEVQETLELYKEQYNQMHIFAKDNKKWQKELMKLNRTITEKDLALKNIQGKLDEAIQKIYHHEQKQVYLLMEIQKKQVRFKELEKQVKKFALDSTQSFSISDNTQSIRNQSLDLTQGAQSLVSDEFLENKELKEQVDILKKKNRQSERQNNRLLRKMQRIENLEGQKKKLQKMVVDAHLHRTEQLSILVTALAQVQAQNSRLNLLKEKK